MHAIFTPKFSGIYVDTTAKKRADQVHNRRASVGWANEKISFRISRSNRELSRKVSLYATSLHFDQKLVTVFTKYFIQNVSSQLNFL